MSKAPDEIYLALSKQDGEIFEEWIDKAENMLPEKWEPIKYHHDRKYQEIQAENERLKQEIETLAEENKIIRAGNKGLQKDLNGRMSMFEHICAENERLKEHYVYKYNHETEGEDKNIMNKLTREEIQKLSEDKLNWRLYQIRHRKNQNHPARILDPRVFLSPCNYCKSLDAQFELAEKVGMYYSVALLKNYESFYYEFNCVSAKKCFIERGDTKRTGAELLLEAIQEKENHE